MTDGADVDLAEDGDGQEPAQEQALDDRVIEAWFPEHVAQREIDREPGRKAFVEVGDLAPAAIGHAGASHEILAQTDGDGRHVQGLDLEAFGVTLPRRGLLHVR